VTTDAEIGPRLIAFAERLEARALALQARTACGAQKLAV
jgi:hypothetical protein